MDDIDEAADFAYCEALFREYESDPDKGNTISLEEAAKQLGVSLGESTCQQLQQ